MFNYGVYFFLNFWKLSQRVIYKSLNQIRQLPYVVKNEKRLSLGFKNHTQKMFLQIAILLILLSSASGFMVWFFKERKSISQSHNQSISELETSIFNNRNQINFRNANLQNYDFLKFNLNDALIIQPEIQP